MKTGNRILMQQARESLSGKWFLAIQFSLILFVLTTASNFVPFLSLVISGPLYFGIVYVFLKLSRNETPMLSDSMIGFNSFVRNFLAYVLVVIFVILWMILLIVPGIIAAYAYALTFFILADDPSISALNAIKKSKEMMRGNKWKLFCLFLRFIGWMILALCTFGVGFLWLMPYMQMTLVKFYEDVKAGYQEAPIEIGGATQ